MRDFMISQTKKEPWYYSISLDAVLILAVIFAISDMFLIADYLALKFFKNDYYNKSTTEQTIDEVEASSILLNQ